MLYERVAIVHDWLTSMRGGERVVEALYRVFPRADLFTLTWDPARLSPALAQRHARTSAIHRVASAPFVNGRFRALLPLFPLAVESFNLDAYDLVVSSSHCVAIGAIAPPRALHIAYVHSTLRYVREGQPIYEASVPGGQVGRVLFRGTARYLRSWETAAAARPHELIANSSYTRERIRRYYGRDARVIEPPIETTRFERAAASVTAPDGDAPFLIVSALVPNKRVDLALRAFQGRSERLVVIGEGPERRRLEPLVGPNVTLLPRVSEAELAGLFARCRALLHPGVDDFGMVMVEALAAGKPVIACAEGGALDIVLDGETGLLIDSPTVDSVRAALDRFTRSPNGFDPAVLRSFAKRFDSAQFERRFAEAVADGFRRRRDAGAKGGANGNGRGHLPADGIAAWTREAAHNGRRRNGAALNGNSDHPLSKHDPTSASPGAANGVHATNGVHAANGAHATNGEHAANGVHAANGARVTNGEHAANGVHAANGAHATNGEHAANGAHATNGAHTTKSGGHGRARRHLPVMASASVAAIPISTRPQNGHAPTGDADMQPVVNRRGVVLPGATADEWTVAPASGEAFVSNVSQTARAVRPAPAPVPISSADHDRPPSAVDLLRVQHCLANHSTTALRAKRLADVVLAASGLALTAPLVVALGALIPLTSPGPALFYQKRIGLHQRPFVLIKLRTMDRRGRVTTLGRLLRPLGLDELPQLWNVVKGDMSVVGPRPELPQLVAEFERAHPGFRIRHLMRPGITGWAQVNGLRGHPNLSIAERLRYDLEYMCEWGLAFDARILARTLSTVIKDTVRSFQE